MRTDLLDQAGVRHRRKDDLAARNRDDCLADIAAVGVLGPERSGAGRERPEHDRALDVGAEDHDPRGQLLSRGGGRDLEPVKPRHLDIEHGHVGPQLHDSRQRRRPIGGLADQLELRSFLDPASEPVSEQGVIIGNDHPRALLPIPGM